MEQFISKKRKRYADNFLCSAKKRLVHRGERKYKCYVNDLCTKESNEILNTLMGESNFLIIKNSNYNTLLNHPFNNIDEDLIKNTADLFVDHKRSAKYLYNHFKDVSKKYVKVKS